MLQLGGMSTAKIVLFHQGSTELRRCENCVFFLPVNILTGVTRRLLGPHDTLPCVLITGVTRRLLGPHDTLPCVLITMYLVVCLTFHFIKVSDTITHTIMMVYVSTCTVKNAKKMTKSIRCFSRTVNCCFNILDVLTKSDC